MPNIKLTISYDGTNYYGWQKIKTGPSIEESLEEALAKIQEPRGQELKIQAASRTDRGVHAQRQVVQFLSNHPNNLQENLNKILPKDIRVLDVGIKDPFFHPTVDAKAKKYTYFLCNCTYQVPIYRHFSWHFHKPLNLLKMNQAAKILLGCHDFSALSCQSEKNPYRTIYSIQIKMMDTSRFIFEITGNRFLHKMVRIIIGTLVYIGCGKIGAHEMKTIIRSRDRRKAGITAPAHGLFLSNVYYDLTSLESK